MKILIFIGLKIVESLAVIFIPYFIGLFVKNREWFKDVIDDTPGVCFLWFTGFSFLLFTGIMALSFGVVIMENWELAGKLIN